LKVTNILYFDPTHIVEPWALKYQQQFKALPKLEILAHGLTMPTIVAFHNKEQRHV
jgi:predicted alpha/beta hydrolase family esterase